MAVTITVKKSATADKRPTATSLVPGELALNYDAATGGLYYANTSGTLTKVGPTQVGSTAPNTTPAGAPGNSLGEQWFDTTVPGLKVWTGTAWEIAVKDVAGATPTVRGSVLACTTNNNTYLGCNAGLVSSGNANNAGVGVCALGGATSGSNNVAVGRDAGSAITTGSNNVAIGCGVQVASTTGSCQLALGPNSGSFWLTGDSTLAVKPGAGLRDGVDSLGAINQVLMSTGSNGLVWTDQTFIGSTQPPSPTFGSLWFHTTVQMLKVWDGTAWMDSYPTPASQVPVGTVHQWAGSDTAVPSGFLLCNGAAVSRTAYGTLFGILGISYGAGDGSTTFNLPDMRGVFARGADLGRGFDPGRALGTYQVDDLKSHNHGQGARNLGLVVASGGAYGGFVNVNNTLNTGGTETRPKNVSFNFIIKT